MVEVLHFTGVLHANYCSEHSGGSDPGLVLLCCRFGWQPGGDLPIGSAMCCWV
jgi:hypothetical protein